MSNPSYILDANVFIEAARRYYAFDIAKGFWVGLIEQAKLGKLVSIDRVAEELERGKDDLCDWGKKHFRPHCASTDDAAVAQNFGKLMNWVQTQPQFLPHAKAEFANGVDGWIIAYALTKKATLVTHEVFDPNIKRKVPIPNVCRAFDVPHIDTFELMRRLGMKLALHT